MSLALGRFVLPDQCCMCIGDAETMHECSTPGGKDGRSFVISFSVPICLNCQSRMKRKRAAIGLIAAVLIGGTLFAMWALEGSWGPPWTWVGGSAFSLGIVFVIWLMFSQPASALGKDNDRIVFRNKKYQRLFDEANRNVEATASEVG